LVDTGYLQHWDKPFDLIDHCDYPHIDEVQTDKTWITRCGR
jgi:hypothetical protein